MLVKAQTFKKTSRRAGRNGYDFSTASGRRRYLEHDGRAVEVATQNVVDERRWSQEMDRTTRSAALRGTVTGREYVLSPSPEDHMTPVAMRDFALEWVARCFPDVEAAVVVHLDSKERISLGKDPICHAHVYVNAVDLSSGKKVTIDNRRAREVHDVAQGMCRERGLSVMERYVDRVTGKVVNVGRTRPDSERNPAWYRRDPARRSVEYDASLARASGIGRYEYDRAVSGRVLEKTVVRRSVRRAVEEAARSGEALADVLSRGGVMVARAADGDLKFSCREGDGRWFRGRTLGTDLQKDEIARNLARGRTPEVRVPGRKGLSL